MKIHFNGSYSTKEAIASLDEILQLFRDRYGIDNFDDVTLSMNLLDKEGEVLEIIDATSAEVYDSFDIYKNMKDVKKPKLRLIVDNTRH